MHIIETKALYHHFSKQNPVLSNIELQVPEKSIYGFLGPNGAGKSTTLKLILGLLKKQTGSIHLFQKSLDAHRIEILRNTGSLIETPSLYDHLTARENLLLLQKIYRCPVKNIDEVLALVDLQNTAAKKVKQFSLGMKQRLGIAVAMLHNPSLLILDEPTNGLDPNGMIDIRELLKKINRERGTTILISSHLLSEIEKLVTHVGIISKGSMVFQGTLPELMNKRKAISSAIIRTNNNTLAAELLQNNSVKHLHDEAIEISVSNNDEVATIIKQLVNNNINIYEVRTGNDDLEKVFMDLIN